MQSCVFCKIVKGEIPAVNIFEDDDFLAFLDVKPINPGHLLLVPKKHTEYMFDLPDEDYLKISLKAKELAVVLKEKLQSQKIGLVVEGFGVLHVHVHLIPINGANELNPERAKPMSGEELKKIAEKIKL